MPKKKVEESKKLVISYKYNPDYEMEELIVKDGKSVATIAYGNVWDDHGEIQLKGITAVLHLLGVKYELKKNMNAKCNENGEFK